MNVIKIKSYTFSIIFSMFTLFVYSRMFIVSLFNSNLSICPKILSLLLVYSLLFLFHSIIFTKKTYKIFLYIFCFLNSLSMYFMDTYHVMINKDTIINLIETNINEVQGFINFRLFLYLIIFCVLILIFIIKFVNINFLDFKKEIKYKIYSIIVFLFSSTLILLDKNYLYEIRENKILVNYVVPINYIRNLHRVMRMKLQQKFSKFVKITDDFIGTSNIISNKKNLIVIVVGESVRAKNWALNGYKKNTTEFLDKYKNDIVNFSNVESCGSSTFISVPCIFSHLSRSNFSVNEALNTENLLDILSNFGFDIFWLSNNGGCKGVCNRIKSEYSSDGGYDDKIFERAKVLIKEDNYKNILIVLHQSGSHGPLYYEQYPKGYNKYRPNCRADIKDCSIEEVINSYDNSIFYTSYLLSNMIDFLKKQKQYDNILFLYVSDHGESFGEKNMFMHAAPYIISKNEQWKVPMFMWIKGYSINSSCINKKVNEKLSHDNVFHSILGLLDIEGKYYNSDLDLFNGCKLSN